MTKTEETVFILETCRLPHYPRTFPVFYFDEEVAQKCLQWHLSTFLNASLGIRQEADTRTVFIASLNHNLSSIFLYRLVPL